MTHNAELSGARFLRVRLDAVLDGGAHTIHEADRSRDARRLTPPTARRLNQRVRTTMPWRWPCRKPNAQAPRWCRPKLLRC